MQDDDTIKEEDDEIDPLKAPLLDDEDEVEEDLLEDGVVSADALADEEDEEDEEEESFDDVDEM